MIVKRHAGLKLSLRPTAGRSRMSPSRFPPQGARRRPGCPARAGQQAAHDGARPVRPSTAAAGRRSAAEPQQPEPPAGGAQKAAPESPVDVAVRREALVRLLKGEMPASSTATPRWTCRTPSSWPRNTSYEGDPGPRPRVLQVRPSWWRRASCPLSWTPRWSSGKPTRAPARTRESSCPRSTRTPAVKMTFQVTGIAAGNLFRSPTCRRRSAPTTCGTRRPPP